MRHPIKVPDFRQTLFWEDVGKLDERPFSVPCSFVAKINLSFTLIIFLRLFFGDPNWTPEKAIVFLRDRNPIEEDKVVERRTLLADTNMVFGIAVSVIVS